MEVRHDLEASEKDHEDAGLEEEVADRDADLAECQHLPREGDLLHDAGVGYEHPGGGQERVVEQVPGEKTGEEEEGEVRCRVVEEVLEDYVVDEENERRVEEAPEEPEDGVLVADLELLANEEPQQLA